MQQPSTKTIAFFLRLATGLALLIGAGGLAGYLVKTKPTIETESLDQRVVRVRVMRVEPVEVARQWRGFGTTQAKDTADVPARVGATVSEIPPSVEVGKVVEAGQVLARLDPTDFHNTLHAAEKRIAEADALIEQLEVEKQRLGERLAIEQKDAQLARTEYQRQFDRLPSGAATQNDIDRAERALLTAERAALATQQQLDAIPPRLAGLEAQKASAVSQRDTAQANVNRTVIVSPIAGVIESLDVEVGENLAPGARVARVIDPRQIEVPLQLPASARSYVTVGNRVVLRSRSQPEDCPPWEATVTRIGVEDGPTRTFTVYAEVDQSLVPLRNFAEGGGPYKLPVGAFVLARLDTADPAERAIIPARSIQEGRVRTVRDGQVVGRAVRVAFDIEGTFKQFGLPDDQWVVLATPLAPGELVVLSASLSVLDGQRVEPLIVNDLPRDEPDAEPRTTRNGGPPDNSAGDAP